ncbi:MAG: hypothetical protein GY943_25640, partial [Chloroflexi bacterium]|nr:hypothetical protein [Chloroflexota bacterium]
GIPAHFYKNRVCVGIADALARVTPLVKTAVFANARNVYPQFGSGGNIYEGLLLSEDRAILEGTGSNFIGVRDGTVLTAKEGILEGVTLKIVLKMAVKLGIPIIFEPIPLDDVHTLDEAAMCSSSRALIPIVQIGDAVVGNGRPGSIVKQLLDAYRDYVDEVMETAVSGQQSHH